MTNEEITFEGLLSKALQENDERIQNAAPGSEEYERLVKERDLLMKLWLEKDAQLIEMSKADVPKWRKIFDTAKSIGEVVVKVVQVGGSLAIAAGVIRLGNREGFLSADDFKGLSMAERLLVK